MGMAKLRARGNYSLQDGIDGFRAAMAAMDLHPATIVADGKYHRFTYGTKGKNDKGWYRLFAEPVVAGSFGLWGSEGFRQKWSQVNKRELTTEERREFAVAVKKAREENDRITREKQEAAAKKAQATYQAAFTNDIDRHPYVERKEIVPIGARITRDGRLIIPVRDSKGKTISAQYISEDGVKKFEYESTTKGGYASVNKGGIKPSVNIPLVICEGWATACSIHEATGYPVVAGLSSKGVIDAAHILRGKFGFDIPIIVCAEDDWTNKTNVGYEDARRAAIETGSMFAAPEFGEDRKKGDTDFNDMMRAHGSEAAAALIKAAKPLNEENHEHEPQRSPEVFSDADSDCAPGIAPEPGIPGGAGDEEADRGNIAAPGDAETDPGQSDELIPLTAYEEGSKAAAWVDPYPGAMETLFRICMSYQHKPQPVLTVAAALSAMSACLHGKYRWPDRLRGNLYIIGLAGTGQGKSEPMGLVEHVVSVAGGVYQSNIASAPAVEELLIRQADVRAALVIDEVAHTLTNVTSKNVSPHMSQFGKTILELFTRSATGYRTRLLADKTAEQKDLHHPYMTFYGTSTHEKMNEISAAFIGDGTLGRFMIVEGESFVRTQKVLNYENPRKMIDMKLGKHIRNIYDYGQVIQEQEQECRIMKVSPEADAMLDQLNEWSDDQQESSDNVLKSLYVRAVENIKRIALVLAVWDNEMGTHTRIERCHLEWAQEFVLKSQATVLKFVDQMTDSPIIKKANKTLKLMEDAVNGNKPFPDDEWNRYAEETGFVQHRAIYRKANTEPKEWEQVVKHLREMGYIEEDDVKKGSKSIVGYRLIKRRKG